MVPSFEHNEGRPPVMKDVETILQRIRPPKQGNPPVLALNLKRMQEATSGGYPVHLYHEYLEPVLALREDQEQELAQLGYVRNYIARHYPRTLFRRNTDPRFEPKYDPATKVLVAEPWVESRIVRDEAHEKATRAMPKVATAGPWVGSMDAIEPLPDAPDEDPDVTIARLQGQLEEARRAKQTK